MISEVEIEIERKKIEEREAHEATIFQHGVNAGLMIALKELQKALNEAKATRH